MNRTCRPDIQVQLYIVCDHIINKKKHYWFTKRRYEATHLKKLQEWLHVQSADPEGNPQDGGYNDEDQQKSKPHRKGDAQEHTDQAVEREEVGLHLGQDVAGTCEFNERLPKYRQQDSTEPQLQKPTLEQRLHGHAKNKHLWLKQVKRGMESSLWRGYDVNNTW